MRHLKLVIVAAAIVSMFASTTAVAQQPSHQHDASTQAPAATAPPMPGGGMAAQMGPHMEMCRMMMGQGGMMGGGDPKQQAEMLAMRGEMMKAMGEIMIKYAQRAQSAK